MNMNNINDWKVPIPILYEDNHLIAVHKPHGLLIQGDKSGDITLIDLVKTYLKEKYQKPGEAFLGLIHRIDRPTGGIVTVSYTHLDVYKRQDDFYIVKMDDNGNVKWTKSIGGIEHENAISILEVNDGGFIIVGSTFTYGAGLHDFYVTKINSYAEVEWIKCFGTDKNDKAATIIKTNYDNFLIIGNTETKNYDKDILIIPVSYTHLDVYKRQL